MTSANHATNARLMKLVTLASTGMACALALGKLVAWWQSDSLAMLSSLTDSCFDIFASILNLIAVRYALKPADDDHRFGHNSIEDIVGLAQCAFIFSSMLIIMLQSVERLTNPQPLAHEALGMGVSLLAMASTCALVAFQTYVAKRTGSLIVNADRLHYVGDIGFNFGVFVALLFNAHFGWSMADPIMALVIAAVVLWSSRKIGIRAFHNLMDKEMPETEKARILAAVAAFPEIKGLHHLKTRFSGTKAFIQMHAELDAALSFPDAHSIIDRLEQALLAAFPEAEIIIHPDPVEVPQKQ